MYRCKICYDVSKPNQQMVRHTVTRPRPATPWNKNGGTEIAREVEVCPACLRELSAGMPLDDLMAAHALDRVARLEGEKARRSARKQLERTALGRPRQPLLQRTAPSPRPAPPLRVLEGGRLILRRGLPDNERQKLNNSATEAPADDQTSTIVREDNDDA